MRALPFVLIASIALALAAPLAAQDVDAVRESIRRRIENAGNPPTILIEGEVVHAFRALPAFYEARGFAPAWVTEAQVTGEALELLRVIDEVEAEGLRPTDYHREALMSRRADGLGDPRARAEFDLLLTDAFLVLASHLVSGRVEPVTFDPEWIATRREVDIVALLEETLELGGVRQSLADLAPPYPGYRLLREALARYRALEAAGGWPALPEGPTLRIGDRDSRVQVLRRRLQVTGDLEPSAGDDSFDEVLAEAVKRYQARNGLDADGAVGKKTRESLNVGVGQRIREIELNLERWRWLPLQLGDRYVLVNIPAFRLNVFEDPAPVLTMKVIVGRNARRTPVFSDLMRYLVLSPSWEVPPTILRKDKLPEIRRNPEYPREQRMQVFQLRDGEWREVDPSQVDWERANGATIRLRQRPGPDNALGLVKFMFPNPFNVYLHDTPARELFSRTERDFSSGCIRVERPLDLAVYLLADDERWNRESIQAGMHSGVERTVNLARPIPVHIQYWTAWADEDGTVEFRRDIYGRDARLDAALDLPPPREPEDEP